MLKSSAIRSCLALIQLLLPGAASAQDPGDELRRAASAGEVAKVRELLDKGVDVDAVNQYGATALSFASRRGHVEVIKLLLERGADPLRRDNFNGLTPLLFALRQGHTEIARIFLAKTGKVDFQMLRAAVFGGNGELVKAVLGKGEFTPGQLTDLLVMAQQEGKEKAVKALEAAGVKPPPPASFEVDEETLRSYAGTYESADGFAIAVSLRDGALTATAEEEIVDLVALDITTFRAEQIPSLKLIFKAENGKIIGLMLDEGDGNPMQLEKKTRP
jgi:Ankyrin repeats (many copies)